MTVALMGDILSASALRAPGDIAFFDDKSALSFAEAEAEANRLAHLLIAEGVKPGDRVALYLPRVIEAAVALYAGFKAGAVVVPIDPETPASRVRTILRNGDVSAMIAREAEARRVQEILQEPTPLSVVIGPDRLEASLRCAPFSAAGAHPATPPDVAMAPGDAAYIIHTSGSTGAPKGITHSHASGLAYTRLIVDLCGLRPTDRIACPFVLQFDFSLIAYFGGPYSGASTLIIPAAHTRLPVSLSALLASSGATVFFSVSSGLAQLIGSGIQPEHDLSSLRLVVFGGEAFQTAALAAGKARLPGADFLNLYGPAETNACLSYTIPAGAPYTADPNAIPIGEVWDKTQALVLDGDGDVVPRGEAGELAVTSVTTMIGYWGRDDLNARAFVERGGATYYLTGDLVRQDQEGLYWLLGRKGRQIKLRGYRIELDEVESALTSHPDVVIAGAVPVRDAMAIVGIAATVQLRPEAEGTDIGTLMRHVRTILPGYAVPSRIDIREALPMTATGKVDRKTLEIEATQGRLGR